MPIRLTASTLGFLCVMTLPLDASAQPPQTARLNKPVCAPTATMVGVQVRDAQGKPVPGTTVEMTRLRDNKSLGRATEMSAGKGDFVLLESDALQWIGARGDSIRVHAKAGARSATSEFTVGRDTSGCKIVKLAGPDVLTLK